MIVSHRETLWLIESKTLLRNIMSSMIFLNITILKDEYINVFITFQIKRQRIKT